MPFINLDNLTWKSTSSSCTGACMQSGGERVEEERKEQSRKRGTGDG